MNQICHFCTVIPAPRATQTRERLHEATLVAETRDEEPLLGRLTSSSRDAGFRSQGLDILKKSSSA
jgi:hypothetical protein